MTKKIIIAGVAAVAVVGIGAAAFYLTQPAAAPSGPSQDNVQHLSDSNSDQKVLRIVSAESKATYELNEDLRGVPTRVVGATSDIAGDIAITMAAPQGIQIGEVKVNARTFKTDIAMRDENVKKLVLKSDVAANEFITFKTTSVAGVPATIEKNKDFAVTIVGDITIAGVTKPATFTGMAKLSDANVFTLNANTMVTFGDFGVTVPDFSFLANVDKVAKLSISLVAK